MNDIEDYELTNGAFEKIIEDYKQDAENMNVKLNPDINILKLIFIGLFQNGEKYGKLYCPCKLQKIDDNICICKDMRENKKCHCKLFITEDNECN